MKDANDILREHGASGLREAFDTAVVQPPLIQVPASSPFEGFEGDRGNGVSSTSWPAPKPLPDGLLPVPPFELDFLPASICPWVADIAERMQCPLDFVGVPATVALGSVIGRKIGVRPQRLTDWIEVPNLWGCIIGRPGTLKSPALQQALAPCIVSNPKRGRTTMRRRRPMLSNLNPTSCGKRKRRRLRGHR
jgi:hypothetical protein